MEVTGLEDVAKSVLFIDLEHCKLVKSGAIKKKRHYSQSQKRDDASQIAEANENVTSNLRDVEIVDKASAMNAGPEQMATPATGRESRSSRSREIVNVSDIHIPYNVRAPLNLVSANSQTATGTQKANSVEIPTPKSVMLVVESPAPQDRLNVTQTPKTYESRKRHRQIESLFNDDDNDVVVKEASNLDYDNDSDVKKISPPPLSTASHAVNGSMKIRNGGAMGGSSNQHHAGMQKIKGEPFAVQSQDETQLNPFYAPLLDSEITRCVANAPAITNYENVTKLCLTPRMKQFIKHNVNLCQVIRLIDDPDA